MAKVTVNASGAFRKILKTTKKIDQASTATVTDLLDLGKDVARQYVPKFSRQTYEAISKSQGKTKDGPSGKVFIKSRQRDRNPNLTTVDVAKMLADPANRVKGHNIPANWIRSGSRNFMSITKNWLNRRKIMVAEGNFKQVKIK